MPWSAIILFLMAFGLAVLGLSAGLELLDVGQRDPQVTGGLSFACAVFCTVLGILEAEQHAIRSTRNTRN